MAVAALLWACGPAEDSVTPDLSGDVVDPMEEVLPETVALFDVAPELVDVGVEIDFGGKIEVQVDFGRGPGPGEAGWPCDNGAECDEGWCIKTAEGQQCTVACQEECPFDWACVLYTPMLPDQIFLCVPTVTDLCRPCRKNSECWTNDVDAGQTCVEYGAGGNFCGAGCDGNDDCPEGYQCGQADDVSGGLSKQCVLAAGECDCKPWFVDDGATTDCYQTNEWGTCLGERMCTATGLSACPAAQPADAGGKGHDDDCDGDVDEGLSGTDCLVINTYGACAGTNVCEGGLLICQGAEPEAEQCDGLDNDCDGEVDESFEDTDGDGVADCLESDIDGDGTPDVLDNCPALPNQSQLDTDLDTVGNACDPDDDNDQVADDLDCAPLEGEIYPGADETCDGLDNNCNLVVDEGFNDNDFDSIKDCVDTDDDNDGISDEADCEPSDPLAYTGAPELCDGMDNDCDQDIDEVFPDMDGDGAADCVDEDADGDGVIDSADNCVGAKNAGQEDLDQDGLGDACDPDVDGDAIPDSVDNCVGVKNTSQTDTDGDGAGDVCDNDIDGDGVDNGADNCVGVENAGQDDADGDGIGDACEDDKDGDGSPDTKDCAEDDPAIFPGAEEICDGLDNDCDFLTDEGFNDNDFDSLKDCVDMDDDNDGDPDGSDCAPLDAAVNKDAVEVCDGVDNNCDGETDEGLGATVCGKGQCAHEVDNCIGGMLQVCDPMEGVALETCDGFDNDCDGLVDEDQGSTTCGFGLCQHTAANCVGGVPQVCDEFEGAGLEQCDGKDNDCDGQVDEAMPTLACGEGQCFHTVQSCIGGVTQQCDPLQGAQPEVCDGVDNDCDEEVDEGLGVVTCGKGNCLHDQPYCVEGKIQPCDPFLGSELEQCDLQDNDCDGLVDEELGSFSCGQGTCAHPVAVCVDGAPGLCDPFFGAEEEVCDGKDNNCNGGVDEGMGEQTCGLGACEHTVPVCEAGELVECDPMEGWMLEECDGLDNDCDGTSDNGFNDQDLDSLADCVDDDDDGDGDPDDDDCEPLNPDVAHGLDEVCFNGIDDNCDAAVDDGDECILASCRKIKEDYPDTSDGVYTIEPQGDGEPFDVYCDMTSDGGGWTLVLKLSKDQFCYGSPKWTDSSPHNEDKVTNPVLPNAHEYDAKSRAFHLLADTTELRFYTSKDKATSVSFSSPASPRKLMTTNEVPFSPYPDYESWRLAFGHDRQCAPIFMRAGSALWDGSCRNGGSVPSGCGQPCVFCYQASDGNYGCPASPGGCGSGSNNDVNAGVGNNANYCGGGDGADCSTASDWSDANLRTNVYAR